MLISERKRKIDSVECLAEVARAILRCESEVDQNKEHVWVIGLNTRLVVQYVELVSLGTLNASPVHSREIFRLAIMRGVYSIAMVHNHPSGDVSPSEMDNVVTRKIVASGDVLGIKVLDHLIIGTAKDSDRYSFSERGLL